jgi:hypothetical protein
MTTVAFTEFRRNASGPCYRVSKRVRFFKLCGMGARSRR